jgi:hypothetical protein
MDTAEYGHQVSALLAVMLDPKNNFKGRDYALLPKRDNVMEALTNQPGRDGSGVYSIKLVARTSTSTRLRLTRILLEKLGTVKTDWPG